MNELQENGLLIGLCELLHDGRDHVAQVVNSTMVQTYW